MLRDLPAALMGHKLLQLVSICQKKKKKCVWLHYEWFKPALTTSWEVCSGLFNGKDIEKREETSKLTLAIVFFFALHR